MKTYEQLMKHYWGKIVPMAESAGINPWGCVRHDGDAQEGTHPRFILKPYERYTFALTVLEGKPVFDDHIIYSRFSGNKFNASEVFEKDLKDEYFTWIPPTKKRTFMLELDEDEVKAMVYVPLSVQAKLIKLFEKE